MEIKELEKNEIEKVVDLYQDVALSDEEKEAGRKRFENDINDAFTKDHMLIAIENENVIGFSWSRIYEDMGGKRVDKMIRLIIPPEKYGTGIGGALIENEMKYAKEKGVDAFDIEVGRL
ncbi:MAG: GNAT family N-acetyltransferase [Thermoplasmata archaeon]|nr:MAG: GNAT family N-acetyltransferase [Thermoplasmata archaeon]